MLEDYARALPAAPKPSTATAVRALDAAAAAAGGVLSRRVRSYCTVKLFLQGQHGGHGVVWQVDCVEFIVTYPVWVVVITVLVASAAAASAAVAVGVIGTTSSWTFWYGKLRERQAILIHCCCCGARFQRGCCSILVGIEASLTTTAIPAVSRSTHGRAVFVFGAWHLISSALCGSFADCIIPYCRKPYEMIETFEEALRFGVSERRKTKDAQLAAGQAHKQGPTFTSAQHNLAHCKFVKLVMPKGGRLVFKGGEVAVSSRGKKKDKIKRKRERALAKAEAEGGVPSTSDGAAAGGAAGDAGGGGNHDAFGEEEMRPISGAGRITSSGTAVQGHEAKFMDELHAGDAILITHPTT